MADSTLEEVARGWALWVAGDILEALTDRGIVDPGMEDDAKEVLVEHLYDVAVSNATQRQSADSTKGTGK